MRPMRISIATLFLALLATLLASLAAIQVSQSNLHSLFGTPPLGRGELLFDFEPGNIARLNIANSTGATADAATTADTSEPWAAVTYTTSADSNRLAETSATSSYGSRPANRTTDPPAHDAKWSRT